MRTPLCAAQLAADHTPIQTLAIGAHLCRFDLKHVQLAIWILLYCIQHIRWLLPLPLLPLLLQARRRRLPRALLLLLLSGRSCCCCRTRRAAVVVLWRQGRGAQRTGLTALERQGTQARPHLVRQQRQARPAADFPSRHLIQKSLRSIINSTNLQPASSMCASWVTLAPTPVHTLLLPTITNRLS